MESPTITSRPCRFGRQIICLLMLGSAMASCARQPDNLSAPPVPESDATVNHRITQPKNTTTPDRKLQRGVYAGIGLGVSELNPDTSEVPNWNVDNSTNGGSQFTLGADLSRQLSIELHHSSLGTADLSPQGHIGYEINAASALFYAGKNRHNFLRQGFSGYGRIGFGQLTNDTIGPVLYEQVSSTHLLFGLGLEYMTRIGLGLRADYIAFDKDVQYAQLGLIYRPSGKRQKVNNPLSEYSPKSPAVLVPVPAIQVARDCSSLQGVISGITFHTDSAVLTDSAKVRLSSVAESLRRCNPRHIVISGHTDDVGPARYNLRLSRQRVGTVAEIFEAEGIDTNKLQRLAYGELKPLDSNAHAQGRAANRRVELAITY